MAEWYDAQNMGSAFPLLDYGTQTIARNVNNALGLIIEIQIAAIQWTRLRSKILSG